jgi:hypothetical protein
LARYDIRRHGAHSEDVAVSTDPKFKRKRGL